jgi:hypothetical protein
MKQELVMRRRTLVLLAGLFAASGTLQAQEGSNSGAGNPRTDAPLAIPGGPGGLAQPNPLVTPAVFFDGFADYGADNGTAAVVNTLVNYPLEFGDDWALVNRLIIPTAHLEGAIGGLSIAPGPPTVESGSVFGLSDINYSALFTRTREASVHWALGPSVWFPSATDPLLGTEKWAAGFGADALYIRNPWIIRVFARQRWSFAGADDRADVNQSIIRPMITYGLEDGWFLISDPIISVNWGAPSGNRWSVPVGAGLGRAFKIGEQSVSGSVGAYYHVARPDSAPEWSINFNFGFVFGR